jgi:hypothetical protein
MKFRDYKAMLAAQPTSADDFDVVFQSNAGDKFPVGANVEIIGGDTNYDQQGAVINQPVKPVVILKQA